MSRFGNTLIGPHSRHRMKSSSPYATLLLDVGMGLCEDDVSSLKLALQVDKFVKRMDLNKLKNGHEILSHMYGIGLISETDTQFLENLLIHICRKDLVKRIEHYHSKRLNATDVQKSSSAHPLPDTTSSENTVPKQVFEAYDSDTNVSSSTGTSCKSLVKNLMPMKSVENTPKVGGVDVTDLTALKTVIPVNQYYPSPAQSIQNSHFAPFGASPVLSSAVMPCEGPVKTSMPLKSENRPKGGGDSVADFTALKTPVSQYYQSPQSVPNSPFAHLGTRSAPEGVSISNVFTSTGPNSTRSPTSNRAHNVSELSNSSASSQEDIEMKNSQRCSGSQDSQMSISDDEKLGYYHDKALFTDGDSSLSNMQLSQ